MGINAFFNEIYGYSYRSAGEIINKVNNHLITKDEFNEIVKKTVLEKHEAFKTKTFSEDSDGRFLFHIRHEEFTPPPKKDRWFIERFKPVTIHVVRSNVQNVPETPLSTLQKRWMKSLLSDPRITLFFDDDFDVNQGLEDVDPLFEPDIFIHYDRSTDADPYEDDGYRSCFRTILKAIEAKCPISLCYTTRRGEDKQYTVMPDHLEYSEKDDRFRLIASTEDRTMTFNLSNIRSCAFSETKDDFAPIEQNKKALVFRLKDERNALDRVLRDFSHFEKKTHRIKDNIDGNKYEVTLQYDQDDENEMVIRLLSFGPVIKVIEPKEVIIKIREKIENQKECIAVDVGKA